MEWIDEAVIIAARPLGEGDGVISLFSLSHGRHLGLAKGAFSRRNRAIYQIGTLVQARWRARLDQHLGHITCEIEQALATRWLDDANRLAALCAACALIEAALPEREPCPDLYHSFKNLIIGLDRADWPAALVFWEIDLLRALGYGLDLSCCAATGHNDALAYVSPKSGRAVSLSAGEAWKDRLLPLPAFLLTGEQATMADILAGLKLSGYFLDHHAFKTLGRKVPPARDRLLERLRRMADHAGSN